MIDFFNSKMKEYQITKGPGDSVVGAQIEKNYAFIEVNIIIIVSYKNLITIS